MVTTIDKPLISAIMIVYNGEKFIGKAIDSVLNQTYTNFELLILNDGSSDTTEKIIFSKTSDQRIKYFKNEKNLGLSYSRNKIIDLAQGNLIAVTDSDDISFPERFEKQVNFLLENPEVKIIGSAVTLIDVDETVSETWKYPSMHEDIKTGLKTSCDIANPSSMFLKEVFLKINRYDESLKICEDWDFFYRAANCFKLHNFSESLIYYRVHDNNISKNKLDHTIIYSVYLTHALKKDILNNTIAQVISVYPGLKKELAQKTIKFYSFWIHIYCKLGYSESSVGLYNHVKNNLFYFFDKRDRKIFLKNSLSIFIKQNNFKMIFITSRDYLFS